MAAAVLYQHDAVKVRVGEFVEKPRFLARIFFVVAKKVQFLKQTVYYQRDAVKVRVG